jgi:CRISPR-associated endonuclease Cas2
MLIRDHKGLTPGSVVLLGLLKAGYYYGRLQSMGSLQRAAYPEYSRYIAQKRLGRLERSLKHKGWIRYEYKEAKRIIKLTKRGELEALLTSMYLPNTPKRWDGKWRLVMFDIPEDARHIRKYLRLLLKHMGFRALQASVYVNPYPLQRESVEYLKRSKLLRYIRILRVDEIDNPNDLCKAFKLKLPK